MAKGEIPDATEGGYPDTELPPQEMAAQKARCLGSCPSPPKLVAGVLGGWTNARLSSR